MLDSIDEIKKINLKIFLQTRYGFKFHSSNLAICPFHNDSNPSFSVNNKDGTWLWHCFGCNRGGSIVDFTMEREGASQSAAIEKLKAELQIGCDKNKIIKAYNYIDIEGKLLFQCLRYVPKAFKFRRPDRNGGWAWDLKNTHLVPYRLNEVVNAKLVIIVEGEKDADTVKDKLGYVATTNPMGAGNWRDEYAQYFMGKQIVIVPDNDEAGKSHAYKIAESLRRVTDQIKLIELAGLPEKQDITYWIENKLGDKEDFERLIQDAPFLGGEKESAIEAPLAVPLKDFLFKDIPNRQCLMSPLVAKNELTIISGPAKLGKSILSLNLALSLANGESSWLQFEIKKPCRVLLIQQEVSEEALQERLRKMTGATSLDTVEPCKKMSLENLFLSSERGLLLDDDEGKNKIINMIEDRKPDLLILDPMYMFHTKQENRQEDMTAFFRIIHELIRQFQIAIILIHHFGKPSLVSREGGELHRGSSVISAASDSNWTLSRIPQNKFILTSPRSEYALLCFESRNAPSQDPIILHRNAETLWYDQCDLRENKKIVPQDIVDTIQDNGKEMLQSKIIEKYRSSVSERLIKEAIYEAERNHKLGSKILKGKGSPKLLYLKEVDNEREQAI